MHYVYGVITKDLNYIDKILSKYDEGQNLTEYDEEENYWYNPNGRFDWYEVGGRWNNMLKIKKEVVDYTNDNGIGVFGHINNDDTEEYRFVDGAKIKDILNLEDIIENSLYGIIYNGEWVDEYGFTKEEKLFDKYYINHSITKEEYEKEMQKQKDKFTKYKKDFISKLDKDLYFVIVDIHE